MKPSQTCKAEKFLDKLNRTSDRKISGPAVTAHLLRERFPLRPSVLFVSQACSMLAMSLLLAQPAGATTYNVPNGGNIPSYAGTNTGDVVNLNGSTATLYSGSSINYPLTLPGTYTMNSTVGGTTVTLNDGAGHAGFLFGGTTLNLKDITLTGGNNSFWSGATWTGGGAISSIYMAQTDTFTLGTTGTVALNGNQAQYNGGAIFMAGILNIAGSGLTANSNTANSGNGGAIYANSVIIDGSTIDDKVKMDGNRALGGNGGAIAAAGSVTLAETFGNVSLTNNTATGNGGGLYAGSNVNVGNTSGTVTITGTSNQNAAVNGGGIFAGGSVVIKGSTANSSITLTNNEVSGSGGAIYADKTVTVTGNVNASGNKAKGGSGGAINAGDAVKVTGDATLDGNTASDNGGAINTFTTVEVTNDLTASGNTAGSNGGAITAYTGLMIGHDLTATGNTATAGAGGAILTFGAVSVLGNTTLTGNTAGDGSGGAIIAYGDLTAKGNLTASGNTASQSGGAVWTGGNMTLGTMPPLGMTSNNIIDLRNNTATSGTGGAINSGGQVTIYGTLTASGNTATGGSGGAIASVGDMTVNGNAFLGTAGGNTAGDNGGAINAGGKLIVTGNLEATDNTAAHGGGAITAYTGVDITGNLIATGNKAGTAAAGGHGGAILTFGAATVTKDVTLTNNVAGLAGNGSGGGIIAYEGLTVNGNFSATGNKANGDGGGGAVWTSGDNGLGNVELGSTASNTITLTGNTSGSGGGGAIKSGRDVTLNGTIAANDNTSTGGGGAINSGRNVTLNGTLTANGNTSDGFGGVITASGDIVVNGNVNAGTASTTVINKAAQGGVFFANGSVTLGTGAASIMTLTNNVATDSGGVINSHAAVTLHGNVTATGNQSQSGDGGGVIWTTGLTTLGTDAANTTTLTSNHATGQGGAVYTSGLVVNGTLNATDNSANDAGGAIVSYASPVLLHGDAYLARNTAGGSGGAIIAIRDVIADGNLTLDHNSSGGSGGGILTYERVTVGGVLTASNNTAADSGGAVLAFQELTLNGAVTASGNTAGTNGGALFGGSITTNSDVTLTGNSAGNSGGAALTYGELTLNGALTATGNSAGSSGGALWAGNDLTANGTLTLTGNQAILGSGGAILVGTGSLVLNPASSTTISGNSAGFHGGALWAGNILMLNATAGDITFTGNTQGTATSTPQANALYLNNSAGAGVADLNAGAGRTITFFDPIASNAENGLVTVNKVGAGLLSFDGSQYSDANDLWSMVYGNTDVQAGTFEVANHAVYGVQAADVAQSASTSFHLGDGTTLQGGVMGTLRADAVTFGNDVTLNIAGRQPGTRGVFEIASPSLTLGSGNRVLFNTYLNDGVTQNTDLLRLNGTAVSGNANLYVSNVGGPGALTVGDGIMLVNVTNNGTTDDATFHLAGRVVGGAYEYNLFHGGIGADAGDGNWYLRSRVRPEVGLYVHNLTAASGMFMHTLHDRLGEPQFTDKYKEETDSKVSSVWVRVVGNKSESNAANGEIDLNTENTLVHFGGDLARWSKDGKDRWLFGLMGAYGESDTDARTYNVDSDIFRTARSEVNGYGAGLYLTWYGNKDKPTGPYLDLWGMYGWYHNKVQGKPLPEESYRSQGWTVSAEAGYAFIARDGEKRQWMIEPQAQVAYSNFSENDHREQNGTEVTGGGWDGVTTRLGVRAYTRSKLGDNGMQPFVEANWWHGGAQSTLKFNGTLVSDGTPDNIFELKAGIEGELAKHWQLWGHLGWRQGSSDYTAYEGMIGAKYQF